MNRLPGRVRSILKKEIINGGAVSGAFAPQPGVAAAADHPCAQLISVPYWP
jgi:hypothetical protein